ncbi:MAG: ABC transporter ATP-binding protein [Candidatus Woesearchaeota archaeon]|jgi:ABC-type branched-subunit amino acid transport system ATPase component|nr:ABC transporter ATP-binding protein [Candidatus Woesearchaeota archaeon]MDP7181551.1 ABC transporter ATP-binding protein [Candidatus Woesearchaeota archaeon]MDP7198593.1 ABC transporter ATP-binding protein [Candidatus Woesearchaeota archaeon]MDP7466665.1 ABC transporter ATP-binding protein [Candidatus Woesearchaeota archaeon]MDP7646921.1 ABC transporter ATP-binding protein [Candidatus Woesearchaeota archaeon]
MMLQAKNMSKSFGGVHAVSNCSIKIPKGKITALIGPNGAGKTTLFNMISGTLPSDAGKVSFNGEDITTLKVHERARKGISRTFQMTRTFKNMTVRDNLKLAQETTDDKLKIALSKVRLQGFLDHIAGELSYGQGRLLELARSMLLPHTFLMLDEPTAGVNPQIRQEMKKILTDLRKEGKTVLFIEHDMDFVMSISDHVIVLNEGKLLMEGTPKQVRSNPKVLEAYLGK